MIALKFPLVYDKNIKNNRFVHNILIYQLCIIYVWAKARRILYLLGMALMPCLIIYKQYGL